MYFSPPTKSFYEDILSNILHAILSELLRQSILLACSTTDWTKVIFHEIVANKHQKNDET